MKNNRWQGWTRGEPSEEWALLGCWLARDWDEDETLDGREQGKRDGDGG